MKVKDIMSTDVVTVGPKTSLKDVARLLVKHGISGVPVVDEAGVVLGVVSEGDLLFKERGPLARTGVLAWLLDERGLDGQAKLEATTAEEAMTAPAKVIAPWPPVSAAAGLMIDEGVNRLPVVYKGELVGIVTRADLVRAFVRSDEEIEADLNLLLGRLLLPDMGEVEVAVEEGEVVLAGRLTHREDVEIVGRHAASVAGVVSVESRVTWGEGSR